MGFEVNEISKNSYGGTELMRMGLEQRLPVDLVDNFQIILSRFRNAESDKIRVYWLHDLPGDPESQHLADGGHEKFHTLVFVSNWQMQRYIEHYNLPWSKCIVIENAIEPIEKSLIQKPDDTINLIYHTTPHRGLEIVVPVFEKLCEKYSNIHLDVYSSFKIYGWEQRDQQFEKIINRCKEHPKISYHGTVPNNQIREALGKAHIFAFPSIWPETSCISLIEAMSAGVMCVHPNFAALSDTAGGMNFMYQWDNDVNRHANIFYAALDHGIDLVRTEDMKNFLQFSKLYADTRFNWDRIAFQWKNLLSGLKTKYPNQESRQLPKPPSTEPIFHYKV